MIDMVSVDEDNSKCEDARSLPHFTGTCTSLSILHHKNVRVMMVRGSRPNSWFHEPSSPPGAMETAVVKSVRTDLQRIYVDKADKQGSNNDDESMVTLSICEDSPADDDSFYRAVSTILVTAQIFALLPVRGIRGKNASDLAFRWCSFRILWTLFTLVGSIVMTLLSTVHLFRMDDMTFDNSANAVFFGTTFVTFVLFLQLARNWPELACAWERVEVSMRHYGYPNRLSFKLKVMMVVILSVALVEHVLSNVTEVEKSIYCSGNSQWVETYFTSFYPEVFNVIAYAHWKGALVLIVKFVATFSWNFMDLFIMVLSVALAARVRQVNVRLRAVKNKMMSESFWCQVRQDYNNLSCLTKTVDSYISKIVLLSFGNNLYFICLQLLNTIKPIDSYKYEALYFYWSFVYLLTRTCAVSLYAASIHDESKEPRSVLYSVPSDSYCVEVQRFLSQVVYDDVAFTGLNFFSVTRTLILTVAGTIVTYEIVLVQLNSTPGAGGSETNNNTMNPNFTCPGM